MSSNIIYFCHQCDTTTACTINADSREPQCNTCHGTYVEERPTELPAQQPAMTAPPPHYNHHQQQLPLQPGMPPFGMNMINMISSFVQQVTAPIITGQPGMTGNGQQFGDYFFGPMSQIMSQLMNDEHHRQYGTPPASTAGLNRLTTVAITDEHLRRSSECAICLEQFQVNGTATQLPCKHLFHDACINDWLKLHSTCCTCRKSVEPNTDNTQPSNRTHNTQPATYTRRVDLPHI